MNKLLETMINKRISASSSSANCYNDQYKHVASIAYHGKQWREVFFRL